MKVIAVIPARYASTRFPAKLMQELGGKTIITTTYEATLATGLFDDVFVITDHQLIYDEIKAHGGKVMRSIKEHESGSDRIAEAVASVEADIVINVQGDEPFVNKDNLEQLIQIFKEDWNVIENPNNVKVVVDENNVALYFSRSVIPYPRDKNGEAQYYQHIGVYAFRKNALLEFTTWPMKFLEATEKLEQLRYLEYGKRIKMAITHHVGIGIDTPEDLVRAKEILEEDL